MREKFIKYVGDNWLDFVCLLPMLFLFIFLSSIEGWKFCYVFFMLFIGVPYILWNTFYWAPKEFIDNAKRFKETLDYNYFLLMCINLIIAVPVLVGIIWLIENIKITGV